MKLLDDLGFKLVKNKLNGQTTWVWERVFKIANTPPNSENKKNKTIILKNNLASPYADKNETTLYWGNYIFDTDDFARELLKNVGIIELVQKTKILELKSHIHKTVLTDLGFHKIEQDTWTKGIFLISLQPPKWDNDRGKVIILKKPNVKKLKKTDRASKVVYKGRYFFDDTNFTNTLLDKIGFTYFNTHPKQKNMDYEFVRDKLNDTDNLFIDKEFLNF